MKLNQIRARGYLALFEMVETFVVPFISSQAEIGAFLDGGFKQQAELDLNSLERAIGRTLSEDQRRQFFDVQHRALRWTFLGSAMENRNFLAVLASVSDEAATQVEQAAKSFIMH